MPVPRLLIAVPSLGSGKSTLGIILCAALLAKELRVQTCKVGPVYNEPGHLSHANGL